MCLMYQMSFMSSIEAIVLKNGNFEMNFMKNTPRFSFDKIKVQKPYCGILNTKHIESIVLQNNISLKEFVTTLLTYNYLFLCDK